MADGRNGKWTKARKEKMLASRRANASLRESARVARKSKRLSKQRGAEPTRVPTTPYDAHYVGEVPGIQEERASVDINKLETKAYRDGMIAAFHEVLNMLIRELR